jgi:hypothetical protein
MISIRTNFWIELKKEVKDHRVRLRMPVKKHIKIERIFLFL